MNQQTPINLLNLGVRAQSCLAAERIYYIEQLTAMTVEQLNAISGMGKRTSLEVQKALKLHNLKIKDSKTKDQKRFPFKTNQNIPNEAITAFKEYLKQQGISAEMFASQYNIPPKTLNRFLNKGYLSRRYAMQIVYNFAGEDGLKEFWLGSDRTVVGEAFVYMLKHNVPQTVLAARAGISDVKLSELLTGKSSSRDALERVSLAIGFNDESQDKPEQLLLPAMDAQPDLPAPTTPQPQAKPSSPYPLNHPSYSYTVSEPKAYPHQINKYFCVECCIHKSLNKYILKENTDIKKTVEKQQSIIRFYAVADVFFVIILIILLVKVVLL